MSAQPLPCRDAAAPVFGPAPRRSTRQVLVGKVAVGGGAPVVVLEPCERACLRLAALGCEEAPPTDEGASCVEVCRNAEDSGAVSLDPDCVAQIAQCEDVDACVSMSSP